MNTNKNNKQHYEQSRRIAITAYELLSTANFNAHKLGLALLNAAKVIDTEAVTDLDAEMDRLQDNWSDGFGYKFPIDDTPVKNYLRSEGLISGQRKNPEA